MSYRPTEAQKLAHELAASKAMDHGHAIQKARDSFINNFLMFTYRNKYPIFQQVRPEQQYYKNRSMVISQMPDFGARWTENLSKAVLLGETGDDVQMGAQVRGIDLEITDKNGFNRPALVRVSTGAQIEIGPATQNNRGVHIIDPIPALIVNGSPPEVRFTEDLTAPMDYVEPDTSSWNQAVKLASTVVAKLVDNDSFITQQL